MRKRSKENFKSLTAQSTNIWINPRRPWEDMAYALAGMDAMVSKYARLKYAGEERYYGDLWRYVYYEILSLAGRKKWTFKMTGDYFPVRLAELAVRESTMSDLCRKCNGKGYISTGYTRMDCFSCEGSGALKRTEKFRARFMNISSRGWRYTWRDRFRRDVLTILDGFEHEIEYQLGKRL